jgi:ATP-dependent Lhr-like helicase
MIDRKNKSIIKKRLKRTWHSFFMRFGSLLPIQILTIPIVFEKKNAIIVSSTASGKTEAVIAPICEMLLKNKIKPLSTIYITPTRALANDLYDRLRGQLDEIDLDISIKTGDKPKFDCKKPPDILITTPESLDSLLCRHPDSLQNIKFVIIDEIHTIDGTYRGDQLQIILKRLSELSNTFSTYALSATVSSPEDVAKRYMKNFEIVCSDNSRLIKETYVLSLEEIYNISKKEKLKKILIFCNSRQKTEYLGVSIKQFWGNGIVVVHHGSLAKTEREETEYFMKTNKRAVCVSTTTLEIGIDIGDIDAVVLADVPWDISSLIQRIGRSGRKSGFVRVFLLCDSSSKELFEEMINAAKNDYVYGNPYVGDLSVVVQQIFSILFANPNGVKNDYFYDMFSNFCTNKELESIISHLLDEGYLITRFQKLYASEYVMNLGERGIIHSNIPNTKSFEIINIKTNKKIGEIKLTSNAIKNNDLFALSGKTWQIEKAKKNRVYVKPSAETSNPASFNYTSNNGAYSEYLPVELTDIK